MPQNQSASSNSNNKVINNNSKSLIHKCPSKRKEFRSYQSWQSDRHSLSESKC